MREMIPCVSDSYTLTATVQPAGSSQQPGRLEQSVLLASVLAWEGRELLPSSIMKTSCGAPQRGGKPRHAPENRLTHPTLPHAHLTSAKKPWSQRRAANRIRGLILITSAEAKLGGRTRPPYSPLTLVAGRQAGVGREGWTFR